MKKAFLIFFIAMISSIVSFGQLQEVKGVETKLTTYNGSAYKKCDTYRRMCPCNTFTEWFGFSFYNMNSIPVSVEAELHHIYTFGGRHDEVIDVKTFNLKPGEEYIWKQENNNNFQVIRNYDGGRGSQPYNGEYYVKYKAYKIL